jgi:predicted Zn finger-like uncharacterized protein
MDVKCERCNTEYEFDDALVSGRGTTVKCTNCGHKFKIRRSDGDFSEDFWNVTTGDGRTLVFTSLRELQRAIQGYLVERNDRLSRGGLPPKAIGQIPELAPFFDQREAAKRNQSGRAIKTQDGLGPAAAAAALNADRRPRQATKPEFPAPPPNDPSEPPAKATLIGTGPATSAAAIPPAPPPLAGEPMRARAPSIPPPLPPARSRAPSIPPATERTPPKVSLPPPVPPPRAREAVNTVPITRPTPPPPVPAPVAQRVSVPPPVPQPRAAAEDSVRVSRPEVAPSHTPVSTPPRDEPSFRASAHTPSSPPSDTPSPLPPRVRRSLLSEIEDERDRRGPSASIPDSIPRRRGVGGFVIAAVVVGAGLLVGAMWAQKNLGVTLGGKPPVAAPAVDPRVAAFFASGEKALADGNLELAKESFDKASALAEKDPHVLLGLARLAAIRADTFWLKSRLLPAEAAAADEQRITRDGLNELSATARKTADDASAVAPEDPSALRARIDALRIAGDRDGARALVGRLTAGPAGRALDPETAYVLAALDLAEVEPLWSTVLERLKTASSAETGPGRARALLVFALARSGDLEGAKAEADRLGAMPKAHPLLPLLRGFVDRSKSTAKLDAGVADAAVEVRDAGKGRHAAGGATAASGDARDLVSQAEKARAKGDLEKAKGLFGQAVERNPNDSEALTGLAVIAYAQHDLAGARASYKRVIAINPNYMPAVVGLADVEWDSGDKGTAAKMYKDIVDRFPEGAYPGRVKVRAEGGG